MRDLTAVILTYNEEENLRRTLPALSWVPQIVIVDSYSTDQTLKIAQSFARTGVVQRRFDSHAYQWNYGLDLVETEWALTLDADYVIPPEFATEVESLRPADDVVGYWSEFHYLIFGRPLHASIYPARIVLFRVKQGRYVNEGHTQQLWIKTASEGLRPPAGLTCVQKLTSTVFHDDRKPLSRWIRSQDKYTKLEAEYLSTDERSEVRGQKSWAIGQRSEVKCSEKPEAKTSGEDLSLQDKLRKMMFVAPIIMPLYLLFGRGLILDGWRGWYYVLQRTIAEMMLSLRLLEWKIGKK